jgi:hypothetical protein
MLRCHTGRTLAHLPVLIYTSWFHPNKTKTKQLELICHYTGPLSRRSQNITICQRLSQFTFGSLDQAVALGWSAMKWDPMLPLSTPVTCCLTVQAILTNADVKRFSALNYTVKWPAVYSHDLTLDP